MTDDSREPPRDPADRQDDRGTDRDAGAGAEAIKEAVQKIDLGDDPEDDFPEEEKCSFCRRTPFDVQRMVVQGGARICNLCIKEFHTRLNPNAKPKPEPKG